MKHATAVTLVLIVCAAVVRSNGLWAYFYSPDELMHLSISQGASLVEVLQRSTEEVHPPLEQILKWFALGVTDNVVVFRTVYCAVGIAAIAALALAAQAAGGIGAGLACLALGVFMPASVWASVLVRGYGLFLLTCSLAIREFLLISRASPEEIRARSWWLAVWIVLACATNFSGFVVAGALILSLVALFIRDNKPRAAAIAALIGVAVLVEGVVLFSWYFAPGTGASAWRTLSHSSYFKSCASFVSPPVFMLRFLTLFSPLPSNVSSFEWLVGFGASAAVLYLYALWAMAARYPAVAWFVLTQWLLALVLNFTGLYPLVGPRHSIHLLPAIVIPVARLIGPLVLKWRNSVAVVALLLAFVCMRGAYFQRAGDFPLSMANYEAARQYIRAEVASSDLILTSRFGLLYALYETDKLRTFYYPPEPVYAASFVGHPVLASTRERQWQFTRDDLSSVLAAARERGNQLGGAIWLLSFGFQDHVMERIRVCAGEALLTSRGLHLPGVSITRFGVGELEKLATSGGDCLREYQENLCAEGI